MLNYTSYFPNEGGRVINRHLHLYQSLFIQRMKNILIIIVITWLSVDSILSQGFSEPRTITAARVSVPPTLDGILSEDAWKEAIPISNFTQRELREDEPATERTDVRIIYDDRALYVGVWCYDRAPKEILAHELKRDFSSDEEDNFEIIFDTYQDKRNGFLFIINPNRAPSDALVHLGADNSQASNTSCKSRRRRDSNPVGVQLFKRSSEHWTPFPFSGSNRSRRAF